MKYKQMKKSNYFLIGLTTILLCGVFLTDGMLKGVYLKMDLNDPDKNFQILPIAAFKALQITGGNSYAIQIEKAPRYALKVRNSRKSFLDTSRAMDTLKIRFTVTSHPYQESRDQPVGLIIFCPDISFIHLSGTDNLIRNFHSDSVRLQQDGNTRTVFSNSTFRFLSLEGSQVSWYDWEDSNRIEKLSLHITGEAGISLRHVNWDWLDPVLSENGKMVFFQEALKAPGVLTKGSANVR